MLPEEDKAHIIAEVKRERTGIPTQLPTSSPDKSDERLLLPVTKLIAAFRVIDGTYPTVDDFRSHYEMGIFPGPDSGRPIVDWMGISLFTDWKRANDFWTIRRRKRPDARILLVVLRTGEGISYTYNNRRRHLNVYGHPSRLADLETVMLK